MYITVAAVGLRRWFPLWSLIIKVIYILTVAKLFTQNPEELVLSENSELRAPLSLSLKVKLPQLSRVAPQRSEIRKHSLKTTTRALKRYRQRMPMCISTRSSSHSSSRVKRSEISRRIASEQSSSANGETRKLLYSGIGNLPYNL